LPGRAQARGGNAGLDLLRPEPEFARKNRLGHNPSVGGHVAIQAADLDAAITRPTVADVPCSKSGAFAFHGMRHLCACDPAINLLEINQMI